MIRSSFFRLCAAVFAITAAPAYAGPQANPTGPDRGGIIQPSSFEDARQQILAMAGNYKVRFDMQEATSWRDDYEPIQAKISGGYEVVRVIEDTGRHIVLQHLLVGEKDGVAHVIKHWRQDWTYEPESVLTYDGPNQWTLVALPEAARTGTWSQTVWQVDDSPRYGSWGKWTVTGGVQRWRSDWTWRPLARRDAVRKPAYDRYLSINRHSPTPGGWIHWQDNLKMAGQDGEVVPYVQEYTLNTYTRFDDFNVAAADDYWAKTKDYWAAVRGVWDEVIAKHQGVTIAEQADVGSVVAERLLTWGHEVMQGKITSDQAIKNARNTIKKATGNKTAGS